MAERHQLRVLGQWVVCDAYDVDRCRPLMCGYLARLAYPLEGVHSVASGVPRLPRKLPRGKVLHPPA